jgi:hypothetical protein
MVEKPDGSGLFVKQADRSVPNSWESVRLEASFYELRPTIAGLAALPVPRLLHRDRDAGVLVMEVDRGFVTASAACGRSELPHFPIRLWGRVAAQLGALHGQALLAEHEPNDPPDLHRYVCPHIGELEALSRGSMQLLAEVQATDLFEDALVEMAAVWAPSGLIHGDIRPENLLVREANGDVTVRVIDWETCRLGDPAWDVASLLASVVRCLMQSNSRVGGDLSGFDDQAQWTILQSAALQITDSYRHATGGEITREFMDRCVLYLALRLLQFASELASASDRLTQLSLQFVDTASNFLSDRRDCSGWMFASPNRQVIGVE